MPLSPNNKEKGMNSDGIIKKSLNMNVYIFAHISMNETWNKRFGRFFNCFTNEKYLNTKIISILQPILII